ncbi:MAG: RnfABCDGE type electron transport complex subunit D [Eubacteriales bacterium]|nr:RnfABCDGE type electron transport complex subunit D [Eubacteriales bacterium]
MEENFIVSSPPYIRSNNSIRKVMIHVIIALFPITISAIWFYGIRALLVMLITTGSAVAFEYIWNILLRKEQSIGDFSAVVSGMMLALVLPVSIPLWIPVFGSLFMIIIVKMFFGGLGQNFLNPALTARAFLLASWPAYMTIYVKPFSGISSVDAISTATPLGDVNSLGGAFEFFLQPHLGCMGEVYIPAIIIGFIYLVACRVISWHATVGYVLSAYVLAAIFGSNPLIEVMSGGIIFASVFMVTDYTTTPTTKSGRLLFGIGTGLITMLIRYKGGYPEGVTYAILLMNILVPYIEKVCKPVPFGKKVHR